MSDENTYRIFPLGDTAATIDFGNRLDEAINRKVISLFRFLGNHPVSGVTEVIPAISSLTVFYNIETIKKKQATTTAFDFIKEKIEDALSCVSPDDAPPSAAIKRIPVCYDGPDLGFIARVKNMAAEEIIRIHAGTVYRVYMLGFLPGFPYMGEVDERIAVPRKEKPVLHIMAGSVGIAGRQTGIYPLPSPGGWQVIGRTPLPLFDPQKDPPAFFQPGDMVQFYPISDHEYKNY